MTSNSNNQESGDGDRNQRRAERGGTATAANEKKKMSLLECQFKSMSSEIEEVTSKINEIRGIVVEADDIMKESERSAKEMEPLIPITTYLIEGIHGLNQALKMLPQAEAEEELSSMIAYMKNGRKELKELMEVISLLKKQVEVVS